MSNNLRTRDGMPFNFVNGIKLEGNEVTVNLQSYAALRAYPGNATTVRITTPGIAGIFNLDGFTAATNEDNGGTIICNSIIGSRRWRRVSDGMVLASWFQVAPSPVDSTAAFQSFAAYLSTLTVFDAKIPPGSYIITQPITITSTALTVANIQASGAEIVVNSDPQAVAWFEVRNTVQAGARCIVDGITMRHNRPTQRTSNCDMIRVSGFQDYFLPYINIPSADNMGLVVGRGDPDTFSPRSCVILAPRIGGRYESSPHSHASIGDSGIWVTSAPQRTHIISPMVESTGDDGILVGHTSSALAGGVYVTDMDLKNVSNGISISAPYGRITGRIKRTLNTGVQLRHLNIPGAAGSHMRVDVEMSEIGWLTAGETGSVTIPQVLPHGVVIYQGGASRGKINLDGTSIDGCLKRGVLLQPYAAFGGDVANVVGKVKVRRIAESEAGVPNVDGAILWRSNHGGNAAISNVSLEFDAFGVTCPFVNWVNVGSANDTGIDLKFNGYDCAVNGAHASARLLNFEPIITAETGRPKNVTIELNLRRCTYGTLIRYPTLTDAERREIAVFGKSERGDIFAARSLSRIGNSGNAQFVRAVPMIAKRDVGIDGLLMEFDPNIPWMIEVVSIYGSAATIKTGAYLKAVYSPNATNLGASPITLLSNVIGPSDTAFALVVNTSSTSFLNGALEVRGAATGFTLGSVIRAVVTATPLIDAGTVSTN